eukprot:52927_1
MSQFGREISTNNLIPGAKIWHRHSCGKRVLATVLKSENNMIKLHYNGRDNTYDNWYCIDNKQEINRFKTYEYINKTLDIDEEIFKVGEKVDIFVDYPNEHFGWTPAIIIRFSTNNPLQVPQVKCKYHKNKNENGYYWVNPDNQKELAKFRVHQNDGIKYCNNFNKYKFVQYISNESVNNLELLAQALEKRIKIEKLKLLKLKNKNENEFSDMDEHELFEPIYD